MPRRRLIALVAGVLALLAVGVCAVLPRWHVFVAHRLIADLARPGARSVEAEAELVRMGDRVVPDLLVALDDPRQPMVQLRVLRVLLRLGRVPEVASRQKVPTEFLEQLLKDPNAGLRDAAAEVLVARGDEESLAALRRVLKPRLVGHDLAVDGPRVTLAGTLENSLPLAVTDCTLDVAVLANVPGMGWAGGLPGAQSAAATFHRMTLALTGPGDTLGAGESRSVSATERIPGFQEGTYYYVMVADGRGDKELTFEVSPSGAALGQEEELSVNYELAPGARPPGGHQ